MPRKKTILGRKADGSLFPLNGGTWYKVKRRKSVEVLVEKGMIVMAIDWQDWSEAGTWHSGAVGENQR